MVAKAATGVLSEFAPAKVNLFLHVRGRRSDGYHLLESLAVFPALGDVLEAEPAEGLSLTMDGPFGQGPWHRGRQSRAARRDRPGGAPRCGVAASQESAHCIWIGGGSSDAAATLRLLSRLWACEIPDGLAIRLGADVPVCLRAPDPCLMAGVGEHVQTAPRLPRCWMVLVNPLVQVSTGAVFAGLACREMPPGPALPDGGFSGFDAFADWLAGQRNDLQAPAAALCPPIDDVLQALADAPFCRMSGSGATCFALFRDHAGADALAERLRTARPEWWTAVAEMPAHTGS